MFPGGKAGSGESSPVLGTCRPGVSPPCSHRRGGPPCELCSPTFSSQTLCPQHSVLDERWEGSGGWGLHASPALPPRSPRTGPCPERWLMPSTTQLPAGHHLPRGGPGRAGRGRDFSADAEGKRGREKGRSGREAAGRKERGSRDRPGGAGGFRSRLPGRCMIYSRY